MHRALAILELVHEIVEHVKNVKDEVVQNPSEPGDSDAESDFEYFPPASETLLALATTCTTFQEPALDALWREQNTLDNLVKCLPSDTWMEEKKDWEMKKWDCAGPRDGSDNVMLVKMVGSTWDLQIPRDSWERTRYYSRRVRTLSISYYTHPSHTVLRAFRGALRRDGTLFPNLRTLRWVSVREAQVGYNFISDFHGPQLRIVELCVPIEVLPDPNVAAAWPYDAVRGLSLPWEQLERLSIETVNRKAHLIPLPSGCFNPVAMQLSTSLTSLTVDGVDLESLAHLSGLPNLRDLTLSSPTLADLQPHVSQGPCDLAQTFAPWDRYTFSALHALTIHDAPLQYTVDLLNLPLEAPQLQEIDVRATEPLHKEKLAPLYTTLGARLPSSTMRKIVVRDALTFEKPNNLSSLEPVADYRVEGHLLPPLLGLKQVTSVDLRCPDGFVLDDGILRDLAQAWPGLEDLTLLPCKTEVSDGGQLTLESLQILAEHCKRLHTLAIVIKATRASSLKPPDDDWQCRICQDALQTLDIGASAITVSKSSKVAQYLCSVFPSLRELKWRRVSGSATGTGRPQPAEFYSQCWKQVAELLPMLSVARRHERAWRGRER
ncbi:hypothetical protein C8F01DRAFT_1143080 [Mycena amicta]|nr:hypothetical protein C8F01DRAFT_1143080 [Mycena amicta]